MNPLTPRAQQAVATKRKIFLSALALFAEKSYENITVQDICDRSGFSVGAFYHHFKSKDNLLDEGYRLFDMEIEKLWNEEHPDEPLEKVIFLIKKQIESMEYMGSFASMQHFKNQLSNTEKYILNPERFFYQEILHAITEGIEQGILYGNPTEITETILCLSRGIIYDWGLHDGSYSLSERSLHVLNILFEHYSHHK